MRRRKAPSTNGIVNAPNRIIGNWHDAAEGTYVRIIIGEALLKRWYGGRSNRCQSPGDIPRALLHEAQEFRDRRLCQRPQCLKTATRAPQTAVGVRKAIFDYTLMPQQLRSEERRVG